MAEQNLKEKNMNGECKYMVATRCFTYNHAPYIDETLRGFSIQETNFPVAFIVVDDASTDGEHDVLKKWAEENLGEKNGMFLWREMPYGMLAEGTLKGRHLSTFVILLLKENHYQTGKDIKKFEYIAEWDEHSKYMAICEGDDYWIDPQKLQKQVDFMENNPDYVLCHTDFDLTDGCFRNHSINLQKDDNYFPYILESGIDIGTLTSLYRTDVYNSLPQLYWGKGWPMGDVPLWIELSHEGKFKYFPNVTACYRILPYSASHGDINKEITFAEACEKVRDFYANYYGIERDKRKGLLNVYAKVLKSSFKHGNEEVAKEYKKKAMAENGMTPKMWLFYFATVCPLVRRVLQTFMKNK